MNIFPVYENQDLNSRFWGTYCLYFLYPIERLKFYDAFLKTCFG